MLIHRIESAPLFKRGPGCQEINATVYETDGFTFDLLCDTRWPSSDFLYLMYTIDFALCMQSCITLNSNKNGTNTCLGILWASGVYGPLGAKGGSECWFYWTMVTGENYTSEGLDSAIIQGEIGPTVRKSPLKS